MTKYALASTTWDADEVAQIQKVVESGRFTMGSEVRAFEEDFARFVGSRHAVMVNSGSSANLLAIAALFFRNIDPLERGDEIIVPAVSWSTTYAPLQQYGLRVKFVDIDGSTLNIDLDQLERAITDRTRAIFLVHLLGNPVDVSRVQKMCEDQNIVVLEDACESLGARFKGDHVGTFGVMGTFSTFFSHHIATMEGGMVVTDNTELFHILLSLRAHGWTRELPTDNAVTGTKSDDPFLESFRFVLPGYNVRPLEMSGAIGQTQLRKLPQFVEQRRLNATAFRRQLSGMPGVTLQAETGQSSWFGFSMILDPESFGPRENVIRALDEAGIECRPIVAGNFCRNAVVHFFDHEIPWPLKNADRISDHGLFVGNHHYGLEDQIALLAETLDKCGIN